MYNRPISGDMSSLPIELQKEAMKRREIPPPTGETGEMPPREAAGTLDKGLLQPEPMRTERGEKAMGRGDEEKPGPVGLRVDTTA